MVCTVVFATGNMWAQEWNNIYDIVIPFKNKASVDVTDELRKQVSWFSFFVLFRIVINILTGGID